MSVLTCGVAKLSLSPSSWRLIFSKENITYPPDVHIDGTDLYCKWQEMKNISKAWALKK